MRRQGAAALLAASCLAGCLAHREAPSFDDPTVAQLRAGAIVFVDEGSLYRARGDGSSSKRLLAAGQVGPGGRVIAAALSADGKRAACVAMQSIDVRDASGTDLAVHILELDKERVIAWRRIGMSALAPPGDSGRYPVAITAPGLAWSRDGSKLALGLATGPEAAAGRVILLDVLGAPLADLVVAWSGLGGMTSVSWSRDGTWLALGLARLDASGGAPAPVVAALDLAAAGDGPGALRVIAPGGYPAVSPDGTRIAVVSPRDGLTDLAVLDDRGAEVTRFIRPAGKALHHPFWSSDGRFLYYYSLASTGPLGLLEITMLRCLDTRTRLVQDLVRLS